LTSGLIAAIDTVGGFPSGRQADIRSVGDAAFTGPGGLVWLVTGHNGENLIRAEGAAAAEGWHAACDQAWSPGMELHDRFAFLMALE
jgi:hypothetical protein